MTTTKSVNVNSLVQLPKGHVADILRNFERFIGVPLSLRSITGEVVCKTDYFNGPCSLIRGTKRGCQRCRKTYKNIEDRLLRRKVPFVNICYAGFLIFATSLEINGEMVGTLLGSQILPMPGSTKAELEMLFGHIATAVGIADQEEFYQTFEKVRFLKPDFERTAFLEFIGKLGANFVKLALSDTSWATIQKDFHKELKPWGWGGV